MRAVEGGNMKSQTSLLFLLRVIKLFPLLEVKKTKDWDLKRENGKERKSSKNSPFHANVLPSKVTSHDFFHCFIFVLFYWKHYPNLQPCHCNNDHLVSMSQALVGSIYDIPPFKS